MFGNLKSIGNATWIEEYAGKLRGHSPCCSEVEDAELYIVVNGELFHNNIPRGGNFAPFVSL